MRYDGAMTDTSTAAAILAHAASNTITDRIFGGIDVNMMIMMSARKVLDGTVGTERRLVPALAAFHEEGARAMLGEHLRTINTTDRRSANEIVHAFSMTATESSVAILRDAAASGQAMHERDTRARAVETVMVRHLTEDHAATYFGGPCNFGAGSAARYTAEAHVMPMIQRLTLDEAITAVRKVLDQSPNLLTSNASEIAGRKQVRESAAVALVNRAAEMVQETRFDEALKLVDKAELAAPLIAVQGYTYAEYRSFISKASKA